MAGIVIPILSKRTLDFDSGPATIVLAKNVPALGWVGGAMLIRVHATDVASSSTLAITAYTSAPTRQDPADDFFSGAAVATETLGSWTVAPSLVVAPVNANPGEFLIIKAIGTPSGGNCNAVVSIELALKADDPQPDDTDAPRSS